MIKHLIYLFWLLYEPIMIVIVFTLIILLSYLLKIIYEDLLTLRKK